MNSRKLVVTRIAEIAGTWLSISLAGVVLLDDLLFGVQSAVEPRIIEAVVGVIVGIGVCLLLSQPLATRPRLALVVKLIAAALLSWTIVAGKLVVFPFSQLVRFGILIVAVLTAWLDTTRARSYEVPTGTGGIERFSRLRVAIIVAVLLAGGSLWHQRENFYSWTSTIEISLCVVSNAISSSLSLLLLVLERGAIARHRIEIIAREEAEARRVPWAGGLIGLFSGVSIGLYLSVSMLVAQNIAVVNPTRLVYALNTILAISALGIAAAMDRADSPRARLNTLSRLIETPAGLVVLVAMAFMVVGLPWILGTTGAVDNTTAGTLHVAALVLVPMVCFYLLLRLAGLRKSPGYCALTSSFWALGLVVGIAGYLVGGNTYNMDVYIGLAFIILLAHGVIVAWLSNRLPNRVHRSTSSEKNIEYGGGGYE